MGAGPATGTPKRGFLATVSKKKKVATFPLSPGTPESVGKQSIRDQWGFATQMTTDNELADQLRRLDPSAFEEFFKRFEQPVFRFFYCSHRDHHLAQEQTAETFLQLVRAFPRFRGDDRQLRPFVFAVVRHVQMRRWRESTVQPPMQTLNHEPSDLSLSPERVVSEQERRDRILGAMGRLKEPLRSVLLLRFVEGLLITEIGEVLKLPVGTVKSHLHRGRQILHEVLDEEECEK